MASRPPPPPGFVVGGQQPQAPPAIPRTIYGDPRPAPPPPPPPSGYYQPDPSDPTTVAPLRNGPADPARERQLRPLPPAAVDRLGSATDGLLSLDRALSTFQPDFAGNTVTGSAENVIQRRVSGFGTPGQQQWWADVQATDNVLRNALFGASLTPGETAAWERTTVTPDMAPDLIRQNLTRRGEIARNALRRLGRTYRANGYNEEAIRESLGEMDTLLDDDRAGFMQAAGELSGLVDRMATEEAGGVDPETGGLVVNVTGGQRPEPPPEPQGPQAGFLERNLGRPLALGIGDVAQGVGDVFGLVSNPVNAGINLATGSHLQTDLGAATRGMTGAPSPQNDAERFASVINRGGTGGLTLAGGAGAGAPLATGAVRYGLERFAAAPLVDAVSGASGGASGEAARQAGYGPLAQVGASLVGGGAAGLGTNALARVATRPAQVENALVNAGRQEGVTVNRAMVDPEVQGRVTAVDRTTAGNPITRRQMGRIGEQIEGRVERLGRGGEAMETNVGGQVVRQSLERDIKSSGQRIGRVYDAAETASEGVRLPPARSLARVDEAIATLSETPTTNAAEITFLNGLRSDLQNDLSVGALRRLRTSLRQKISNGGLSFGEDEATVLSIMDEASQDIEVGLRQAGRGRAADLFRNADDMYRDRMDFIRNGVQKIIGRRNSNISPEQVFANFRAMATPRGDNARMARMIEGMEPEEQADIAATFASALGRSTNGTFSTAHFLTQARKLPQAARVNLFGEAGARSIDNLLKLSREHARVTHAMGGSPTGLANDWRSWLSTLMLGGGGGFLADGGTTALATGAAAVGLKVGRDVVSARLLMSPNIQSWLRSAPRGMGERAVHQHLDRLRAIAVREPALASDIQQLQQSIMQAANDSVTPSVAASGPEDDQQGNQR